MDDDECFSGVDWDAEERKAIDLLEARRQQGAARMVSQSQTLAPEPQGAMAQFHCARRKSISPFKDSGRRQNMDSMSSAEFSSQHKRHQPGPPYMTHSGSQPRNMYFQTSHSQQSVGQVRPNDFKHYQNQDSQPRETTDSSTWGLKGAASQSFGYNVLEDFVEPNFEVSKAHIHPNSFPLQSVRNGSGEVRKVATSISGGNANLVNINSSQQTINSFGGRPPLSGSHQGSFSLSHQVTHHQDTSQSKQNLQHRGSDFLGSQHSYKGDNISSSHINPGTLKGSHPSQPSNNVMGPDYWKLQNPPHDGGQTAYSARGPVPNQPTLDALKTRIRAFKMYKERLSPPPSSYERCPGVFKHTAKACGAALMFRIKHVEISNTNEYQTIYFYHCADPECDFRELLPDLKELPCLSCEAIDSKNFRIQAAVGAEEIFKFCGGLEWVLKAVGCNTKLSGTYEPELSPKKRVQQKGSVLEVKGESVKAIRLDIAQYEDIVAPLRNQSRLGMRLLTPECCISDPTIALFRKPSEVDSADEVEERFAAIPTPLRNALMPFQREGVMFGLRHKGRVLIADEMGVGKTVQAIALACAYQEEWPVLIIVPASLRLVWAEELERWLPNLRPSSIHVIQGKVDRLDIDSQPKVVITSYEMMMRLTCNSCCKGGPNMPGAPGRCHGPENCMAVRGFKVVIADESHVMRTTTHAPDSRHTEAVSVACKRAKRVTMLTGTPSLSRPFDLYRQIDALRPSLIGKTREQFSLRYCNRRLVPVGSANEIRKKYDNSGICHAHELHYLLKQEVMLRRLKEEVMSQLPPKRRQVIRLPHPRPEDWPKQAGKVNGGQETEGGSDGGEQDELADNEEDLAESGQEKEASRYAPQWSAAHMTAVAKLPNVIEWLTHVLSDPDSEAQRRRLAGTAQADNCPTKSKMLIFAHHIDVMDKLAAALSGQHQNFAGVVYVRIDGSTDSEDRRAAVNRFRDDPTVSVALLSVTAAGVGLDFSSASTVVFVELPDEVAHVRQAEDRSHRKGQHRPVNVYFLVAKGTSDERRWQKLNSSLERVSAVHDGCLDGQQEQDKPAGLVLDAVHDVTMSQGWVGRMTQIPSGPSSKQPVQVEPEKLQDSVVLDNATVNGRSEGGLDSVIISDSDSEAVRDAPHDHDERAREASIQIDTLSGHKSQDCTTPARESQSDSDPPTPTSEGALHRLIEKMHKRMDRSKGQADEGNLVRERIDNQIANPKVFFEVSAHSGRLHFHLSADGTQPLGLSLPVELLVMEGKPAVIENLLNALDNRHKDACFVGPAGVLAIPSEIPRQEVESMITEAQTFAGEWLELRAVIRNRLIGHCLQAPLQDAVDEIQAQVTNEGGFGTSTDRYLDKAREDLELPEGAAWCAVKIKYHGRRSLTEHKQPFLGDERLCCLCAVPVSWCTLPKSMVLESASALFCSAACENKFCLRTTSSHIRRELFKLERGVCQKCKLDCHALVKALRAIEKGGSRWELLRKQKLLLMAPLWGARGAKKASQKLVKSVLEGNAWQADHIVPVYKGGGLCDLDNFRTLCTVCHQEVTKAQAKDRAQQRRMGNQPKLYDLPVSNKKKPRKKKGSTSIVMDITSD